MSMFIPAPAQILATQPDRSNWVSANAGAGKTHVLTQRVARLLLAGSPPERILCLTFTKAAAAEMQTRLFRMLGAWAMAPDADLAQTLGNLDASGPVSDRARLDEARRLFARALETPGGLKIQTIHAFCERLLRRFPLEAGISPRFEVMDERQTALTLQAMREKMATAAETGQSDAFDRAARTLTEDGIEALAEAIMAEREALSPSDLQAALGAHFRTAAKSTPIQICRAALELLDWPTLSALREVLLRHGKSADKPVGDALPIDPVLREHDPEQAVQSLIAKVLTTKFEARKPKGFPSVDVKKARASADAEFHALTNWALSVRAQLMAVGTVERTQDLHGFADGLLGGLDQAKDSRGLLDFQDLVTRARHLLTDRDMRAWVLYKLDQGIDHILVDEAQDTSPEQWAIIQAIADEFLSGEGARPAGRSIFVVGDEKQSIYSFQGAEPRAFGRMRDWFDDRLAQIGPPLGQPRLETSYRSAPAILNFVDAVFQGDVGRGLTATGEPVRHLAHRSEAWGRVDLWPLVEKPAGADEADWWEPVDKPPPAHPKRLLADKVAEQIGHILLHEHLPGRDGAAGQKVRPQDIMVLLAGRRPLAPWLIRGLKARGIPVAGADRLALTAELAVQDLMAVMRIVTLPSDDLSLAALLRSPLCGLTEEELFNLAHRRAGTLWQSVDVSDHTNTKAFLSEIVNAADYERPYEFLERVLGTHDGRRKLLARLGPEAEEAIDELLVQALVFETHEVPSLAGFLAWLEAGDIQVKREMDRGQDAVRVMTVHGAKGLEAPIVILPDTVSGGGRARGGADLLKLEGSGNTPDLIIWAGSKTQDDPITTQARADQEARAQAERARLLYVALTRAEDWLILAGAQLDRETADSWYPLLTAGMERLATDEGLVQKLSSPTGSGVMCRFEIGTRAAEVETRDEVSTEPEPLPRWLKPAAIEPRMERGAPSGLGKGLDKPAAGSGLEPTTARLRGSAIHLALEHLPGMPTSERPAAGEGLLAHAFPSLSAGLRKDALGEALRTLDLPFASQVFGPESLAEVTVAIDTPGGGPRMIGRIDRLIPGDAQILLVDIKTDGAPPARPDDVPDAYLAQLGAYASAVRPSWPDQHLQLAILWTASAELMAVDPHRADQRFREAKFARTGRA